MDQIAKSAVLLDPTANKNVFDYIGFYGPDAVLVMVGILLLGHIKFLAAYVLFYFVNRFVNRILKDTIKQPRPTGSRPIIGESYGKHSYGMPSYHAQKISFAIVFLYLVQANMYWVIAGLAVAALTIYQRWKYRAHSLPQLATGVALGAIVANFGYNITKASLQYIKQNPLSSIKF
jgi:membrane-associated phospholipid phosphatase